MTEAVEYYEAELPADIFKRTIENFERDGASFRDAIMNNPRVAYEMFSISFRDAMMSTTTSLVLTGARELTVSQEEDGSQAFDAIAHSALNVMKPLSPGRGEAVIKVMKDYSLLDLLLRRVPKRKLKEEIRFAIPAV